MQTLYTIFGLVVEYYEMGHEVATYTINQTRNPTLSEIADCRTILAANTGIPEAEIIGFRAPQFEYSPQTFQYLDQLKFGYDSSITEQSHSLITSNWTDKIWPYTLDYGIAQLCMTGTCDYNATYKGLFEIPVYTLDDANGQPVTAIDPAFTLDIPSLYQQNFLAHYEGNRSPMGIFLHPSWLSYPNNTISLNEFIEWTLSHDNVWYITGTQLVAYMMNPQNISGMRTWLKCANNPPRIGTSSSSSRTSFLKSTVVIISVFAILQSLL